MKLKICGMKYVENIEAVADLNPDYLGFIFYDKSPRFFNAEIPKINKTIKKTGVFVDASQEEIIEKLNAYNLRAVQLHGNESPEFCNQLKIYFHTKFSEKTIEIIKVFSVNTGFDFKALKPYENVCDYYLFDTKGKLPGGNGYTFDWSILKDYPLKKPYFLSGGIGLEELKNLKLFFQENKSKYCHAIDVNSKFEKKSGLKDVEKLKTFINTL